MFQLTLPNTIAASLILWFCFTGVPRTLSQVCTPEKVAYIRNCIPETIFCPNPRLELYVITRLNKGSPYLINVSDRQSIANAPMTNGSLKVIIPNFKQGIKDQIPQSMISEYLADGNYNILFVDHTKLVTVMECKTKDILKAARCTANFMKLVFENVEFLNEKSTHLIGIHMGAAVAGAIAKEFKTVKLARLTGLDPWNYYLDQFWLNEEYFIDSQVADFVDIYHTNAGRLGIGRPVGDVDTYFNDGVSQLHCHANHICSSEMAASYYIESIRSPKGFYGIPCNYTLAYYYGNHANQICTTCFLRDVRTLVGEHMSTSTTGLYRVPTDSKPPYAIGIDV